MNVVHSVPWVFRERGRDYSFCFQPPHLPTDIQKGAWLWWITLSLHTTHCGGQIPIHISTSLPSGALQTILKYPYDHIKWLFYLERGFTLKWEVLKRFKGEAFLCLIISWLPLVSEQKAPPQISTIGWAKCFCVGDGTYLAGYFNIHNGIMFEKQVGNLYVEYF